MSIEATVGWQNRLWQGLVTLWSGAQFIAKKLVDITTPYVPGSRSFNRYLQGHMAQTAQRRLRLFTSLPDLPGLDRATRRRLLPFVRHYGNRFAATDVWYVVLKTIMQTGGMFVLFALMLPLLSLLLAILSIISRHVFHHSSPFSVFQDGACSQAAGFSSGQSMPRPIVSCLHSSPSRLPSSWCCLCSKQLKLGI
jgi:hypothetical protein